MARTKSFFESKGFKIGMKYLYGLGAAVVIVGALFKILHLPGAAEMLIVGLGTEAAIFAVSAFEPLPHEEKHYEWKTVFPQLKEEDEIEEGELEEKLQEGAAMLGGGASNPLAAAIPGLQTVNSKLDQAKLPDLFDKLANSVDGIKMSVDNLSQATETTIATSEFGDKIKVASAKIEEMNKGLAPTVDAMKKFGSALTDVEAYQTQVKNVTKNLQSLNSVYELELQDAQKHLNSINKFYGSISNVMNNLLETSKDSDNLRQQIVSLAGNMAALNNVYGGMLNAMASSVPAKK